MAVPVPPSDIISGEGPPGVFSSGARDQCYPGTKQPSGNKGLLANGTKHFRKKWFQNNNQPTGVSGFIQSYETWMDFFYHFNR